MTTTSYPVFRNRFSVLLSFFTLILIIAGGLVTSTDSGLAVPDWPLSFGQLMPPMVGGVRFEHSHRMIASLIGLMTLILTLWTLKVEQRKWIRWFSIGMLGAVVFQGILGGLTVMYLLPAPISIFHATLAQTFFAMTIIYAYATSKEWAKPVSLVGETALLIKKLKVLVVVIFVQLILGATIRHTHLDWVVIPHILIALHILATASMVLVTAFKRFDGWKQITRPALCLAVISLIQVSLGMGAFVYRIMLKDMAEPDGTKIFFVTAHQSVGALLLATTVFFLVRVLRMSVIASEAKQS